MKQLPVKSGTPKYRPARGQKTKKRKPFCHFLPHPIEGQPILTCHYEKLVILAVQIPKPVIEQDYSIIPQSVIHEPEIKEIKTSMTSV